MIKKQTVLRILHFSPDMLTWVDLSKQQAVSLVELELQSDYMMMFNSACAGITRDNAPTTQECFLFFYW